jgi:aspartyl protease
VARAGRLSLMVGWAVMIFSSASAQQPVPAPPPAQSSPNAREQQSGNDAQVRTGTSSGINADIRLQNLLADHQFFRVADELDQLPADEAQLYRGILANRENDARKSIELLEPLINKVAASGDKTHEKLLRKALAEDYLREGDMAKAATAYEALETRVGEKLSGDEKDEIEMPLKMLPLAASNPAMTVEPCDPFVMQVRKDPLGLTDIPVFVDAMPHSWMLDPTAPFNLIARSAAREVGLKVSEDAVTIHTLTGKPMQVHVTVIPRFTIGGRLTLRNMTAFVFEDADYFFENTKYQVQGVLGYPALEALSSVTITGDATIEVNPTAAKTKDAASAHGAHFFLDGDQVILAVGPVGNERMFAVDAAGQQSYFTARYFDEHANEFGGQKAEMFSIPGAAREKPQPAFLAETAPLDVGGTVVHPHFIEVLTQPVGDAALDDVYGMLGVDVLDQFRRYTFDYRNMRFTVGPEDGAR